MYCFRLYRSFDIAWCRKDHLSWGGHIHHLPLVEQAPNLAASKTIKLKSQVKKVKTQGVLFSTYRDNAGRGPSRKHLQQLTAPGNIGKKVGKMFLGSLPPLATAT